MPTKVPALQPSVVSRVDRRTEVGEQSAPNGVLISKQQGVYNLDEGASGLLHGVLVSGPGTITKHRM
jgi:hypothetical protein